jgi:poly-gamma-glutamate capsule biosynthesis protein CapA/YwtB (metallophosphatase superfamily)
LNVEPIESRKDASLLAVGDVAPLHPLGSASPEAGEVWDYLRSSNLTTANLELPLTASRASVDKVITLRANPEVALSLRETGIELVTLANNHALDYGAEGLYDTLSALRDAGVGAVGCGRDLEEAMQPAWVSVGETSVAVFGLASTLPPGFAAGPGRPGIAPVRACSRFYVDAVTLDEQPGMSPWVETEVVKEDLQRACERVENAREEADLVVIHIHWGVPNGWCAAFQGPLADYQRPLGHALIDAGADLVLGHHPHVVHGVEHYKDGLIAYSLGHFLFHSMSEGREMELTNSYPPYNVASLKTGVARQAVILELEVARNRMASVTFRPVRINAQGEPEFARDAEANIVLSRLAEYSSHMDTKVEVRDHEACVAL